MAATPYSSWPFDPGSGFVTTNQDNPSQCSISVRKMLAWYPTAQILLLDKAEMASRLLPLTVGPGATAQAAQGIAGGVTVAVLLLVSTGCAGRPCACAPGSAEAAPVRIARNRPAITRKN